MTTIIVLKTIILTIIGYVVYKNNTDKNEKINIVDNISVYLFNKY
jgi:hypothetical protein